MITYEDLKKFNDRNKDYCKSRLYIMQDIAGVSMAEPIEPYKIVLNEKGFLLVSSKNEIELGYDILRILNFLNSNILGYNNYISNISFLKNRMNLFTECQLTTEMEAIINYYFRTEKKPEIFYMLTMNENEISKLVLQGFKIVYNYNYVYVLVKNNVAYICSHYKLSSLSSGFPFNSILKDCKYVYIENLIINNFTIRNYFARLPRLNTLILDNLDISSVSIVDNLIVKCPNLENLKLNLINIKNLDKDFDFELGIDRLTKLKNITVSKDISVFMKKQLKVLKDTNVEVNIV